MPRDKILPAVTNANGEAVVGALVEVQSRFDNSNATIYADETSASTLVNPVVTDNYGRIPGWLTQGRYNLIVTGAGIASYTQAINVFTPDGPGVFSSATIGSTGPGGQSGVQLGDITNASRLTLYRFSDQVLDLDPATVGAGTSIYYALNNARAQYGYDGSYPAISVNDNSNNLPFRVNLSVSGVEANVLHLTNAGQLQLPITGNTGGLRIGNDALCNLYRSSAGVLSVDGNLSVGGLNTDTSLVVTGMQPASSTGNGTSLGPTVNVTGAKGGNTTGTTGQLGGTGGSLTYTAGAGGDAVSGSTAGPGGSITLAPGAPGGGAGGAGSYGSLNLGVTGCKVGFYGQPAVARQTGYSITNSVTNRSFNAQSYTVDQLAQFMATLANDLKNTGLIG